MELFLLFLTLPFLETSVAMPQGEPFILLLVLEVLLSPTITLNRNRLQRLLPPTHLSWRARARIIGGEEAAEKDWPWQISLRRQEEDEEEALWKHFCSGSLIHPEWVLTAASCFFNEEEEPSSFRVQLREQHLYYEDKLMSLSKIVVHSNFTFDNEGADIALLKLTESVQFSSQVQPIKLPAASQNFSNTECWVTGWEILNPPFSLKQVQVSIYDNHDCDRLYHKISTIAESTRIIPEDMICAGKKGHDTCKGDNGTPLVCKVEDSWLQAGVASWVDNCGENSNRPGVYTDILKYLDWIQKNIQ